MGASEAARLARIAVASLHLRRLHGALLFEDLVQIACVRIWEVPAPVDSVNPSAWGVTVGRNAVRTALRRERAKGFTRAPRESDGREVGRLPMVENVPGRGRQMREGLYEADALETLRGEELLATYEATQGGHSNGPSEPIRGTRPRLEEVRGNSMLPVPHDVEVYERENLRRVPGALERIHPCTGRDLPALVPEASSDAAGAGRRVPPDRSRPGLAGSKHG